MHRFLSRIQFPAPPSPGRNVYASSLHADLR
jgi:hypothetical protein